jgi:hypothetical protein
MAATNTAVGAGQPAAQLEAIRRFLRDGKNADVRLVMQRAANGGISPAITLQKAMARSGIGVDLDVAQKAIDSFETEAPAGLQHTGYSSWYDSILDDRSGGQWMIRNGRVNTYETAIAVSHKRGDVVEQFTIDAAYQPQAAIAPDGTLVISGANAVGRHPALFVVKEGKTVRHPLVDVLDHVTVAVAPNNQYYVAYRSLAESQGGAATSWLHRSPKPEGPWKAEDLGRFAKDNVQVVQILFDAKGYPVVIGGPDKQDEVLPQLAIYRLTPAGWKRTLVPDSHLGADLPQKPATFDASGRLQIVYEERRAHRTDAYLVHATLGEDGSLVRDPKPIFEFNPYQDLSEGYLAPSIVHQGGELFVAFDGRSRGLMLGIHDGKAWRLEVIDSRKNEARVPQITATDETVSITSYQTALTFRLYQFPRSDFR